MKGAWILAAVLLFGSPASAQERTTVLFLTLPTSDMGAADREHRAAKELALALVDLTVLRQGAPQDLSTMPTSAQIDVLRPLLAADEVLAAVWLEPSADPLRVNLAFAAEGRGVVRVVEEPAGDGAEAALAMAAREVLAAARVPVRPNEQIQESESKSKLALRLVGGASVAFDGSVGANPRAALAIELENRLVGELRLGCGFAFRIGGSQELGTFATEAGARGRLAFLPGTDRVGIGPVFGAEVAWLRIAADRFDGDRTSVSLPVIRLTPGAELRVQPTGDIGLSLSVTADILPVRGHAVRRSTSALIHDTGHIGLTALIGLRAPLKALPPPPAPADEQSL